MSLTLPSAARQYLLWARAPVALGCLTDHTASDIVSVSLAGTNLAGFNLGFGSNFVTPNTVGLGPSFPAGTFISLDVTFASAVPEPSTWAMMILGFMGVGFAAGATDRRFT
jgi:PEP-CTERM motif